MTRKTLRKLALARLIPHPPSKFTAPRRSAVERLERDGWRVECTSPSYPEVVIMTKDEPVRVPRDKALRRTRAFTNYTEYWWGEVIYRRYSWVDVDTDDVTYKGHDWIEGPKTQKD